MSVRAAGTRCAVAVLGLLLAMPGFAQAQAGNAPAATAVPATPPAMTPGQFLQSAEQVLRALDRGQAPGLWEGGSPVLKRTVARDAFQAQVAAARAPLGNPVRREWASISRQVPGAGDKLPPGQYVSVTFLAAFDKGNAREIVSFRLEEDGRWRLTGYVVN